MKSYVITLIGVVLLSGIIQIISPEGEMKKYINLLSGLCVVCVIIAPVGSVISSLRNSEGGYFDKVLDGTQSISGYEEIYRDNVKNYGEANAAEGLESMISAKFGISTEYFRVIVKLIYENDSLNAERVTVILHSAAILTDPHQIKDYVNTLLGCPCEIIYA